MTKAVLRFSWRLVLGVAALVFPAQCLYGVSCNVVKHNLPTEADKALLAADYAKAEGLYRADLAAHPGNVDATAGLVHALLREQKVQEAADVVKTALTAASASAPLLTLRGEVEFRQGEPWVVEQTVLAAYKLDPCNPRTRLLFARFLRITSRYATERQQILLAHQIDPDDPEIRMAWIQTLPLAQRITEMEAYLSVPNGDDQETIRQLRADLDRWRKQAGEPQRACRLVSTAAPADIPFISLKGTSGPYGADITRAFGLVVGLNGTPSRLQLGAGEGGLTVYRPMAEHAGLKRLSEPAPGGPGGKPTYAAYADSIKIGNLEFQNCVVNVIDSSSPFDDGDGLIGMDVFSDYLVTVDYPMRKVQLGPLPVNPAAGTAPLPSLKTNVAQAEDSGVAQAGPFDRYIAPEMKDYTQIYRVANNLILPTALNAAKVKLFILDLGASATNISPGVAKDVSKVHEVDMGGPAGHSLKVIVADEITYNFAHMSQKVTNVVAADTSMASKSAGMEISGFMGANTFSLLIMHIDYRDGLLKCEYIPNRGYTF
ncbi:MAG: aspartyl protease family protein [Terracidiphilus sp.]